MRLLILDGSRILTSLVERLVPEGFEIREVATFDEALESLRQDPPDAVIANVGPAELPWREFKEFCREHEPKIPILFESCVYETPVAAGLGGLNHSAAFLNKPYGLRDLREQLHRLLEFQDSEAGERQADAVDRESAPFLRPRDR